ncbi:MAG: S41 family peptidase [Saprospiraceae bacterium]|nr:S41 family peptidase [Saprospiraceae bacterium]
MHQRRNRLLFFILLAVFFNSAMVSAQIQIVLKLDGLPKDYSSSVGIRGNVAPLDWNSSKPLSKAGDSYSIVLDFEEGTELVEFKFVLYEDDSKPHWENIENRSLDLSKTTSKISIHTWNVDQVVDMHSIERLKPEQLQADFELLKTMILKVHPGTFRYNSQEEINWALKDAENHFKYELSHGEAYSVISRLMAQLQCDHTKAGFNNQNRLINSIIHYQRDKVPFTFKWVNDEMVVIKNASENYLLKKGTIITSINGITTDQIKSQMVDYIGADGGTDLNRLYKMEVQGYDFRYYAFDIFFPLLFNVPSSSIDLTIKEIDKSEITNTSVEAQSREERASILKKRYSDFPVSRDDMWDFEVIENQIGMLTINSFGLNGWKAMTIDYKQFLSDAFKELEENDIRHLIIDIRENTGGSDEMAEELFGYLTDREYQIQREGRSRYVDFPEELKPHIKTWGDTPWFYNLNPKKKEAVDGYYIFEEGRKKKKKANKKLYQGSIYLLTSAANTSLAFYTAQRFKSQKLGLLIGQETGGNLNDINGGQILFFTLPNSTIEIDCPVMGGFSLEPQPNTGVQPDVKIDYALNDIIKGRDLEFEHVLSLVLNGRK